MDRPASGQRGAQESPAHPESRRRRRIQRYGWDLAVETYEAFWLEELAPAQAQLFTFASLAPGERVLDVACGTGLAAIPAARLVAPGGIVVGVDLSGRMVETARRRADVRKVRNVRFERMDAERLDLDNASFDVALCSMGLMYMPDPGRALREMRRVLRPGGRVAVSAWGEPARCGLDAAFARARADFPADLLPAFFGLGEGDALANACVQAGFGEVESCRVSGTIGFADDDEACRAGFQGGPIALAWSRLDEGARDRARSSFLAAIATWRRGRAYRIPAEFVVAVARVPGAGVKPAPPR